MRIALVTSEGHCGIAEHSQMLTEAVCAADSTVQFVRNPAWLDPWSFEPYGWDIVHLNYHRGLHSRWTPEQVKQVAVNAKVVITFHDTYQTQPDLLLRELVQVSDAVVVHEPIEDAWSGKLCDKVRYWRQGVPQPKGLAGYRYAEMDCRPYVGTCGFNFPWKGFDLLCEAAAAVGWGVVILSHNAAPETVADWRRLNPWVKARAGWLSTQEIIADLQECDATAFMYQCANSGTSGAIRLGIAAGKPLLATEGCRQFRDLQVLDDDRDLMSHAGIKWVHPNTDDIGWMLVNMELPRFHGGIVRLREQDSWTNLGKKYLQLYQEVLR